MIFHPTRYPPVDDVLAVWQFPAMTLAEWLSLNDVRPSTLAERMGVPPSTVIRVLKRQREPGLDLMRKIAEATDGQVTPNDFLEREISK